MKRTIFTISVFVVAVAALFFTAMPTHAVSSFLIGPKPEKNGWSISIGLTA